MGRKEDPPCPGPCSHEPWVRRVSLCDCRRAKVECWGAVHPHTCKGHVLHRAPLAQVSSGERRHWSLGKDSPFFCIWSVTFVLKHVFKVSNRCCHGFILYYEDDYRFRYVRLWAHLCRTLTHLFYLQLLWKGASCDEGPVWFNSTPLGFGNRDLEPHPLFL